MDTGATIFGLLFGGAGLFLLIRGLIEYRTCKASADWPSVEGQIVTATVETKVDRDEDGTTTKYSPRIVYSYAVSGQQHMSDQAIIGARRWYASHAKAEAKLAHQSGQQISVYYNPEHPAQAVLEAGSTRGAWGTLAIGLVFAILGTVVVLLGATDIFRR